MKSNTYKIIVKKLFIVFALLITAFSFLSVNNVNAAIIDNQCDGDHTGWTPLSSIGGILSTGNYYLADDVTLLTNIVISSGTVNIDLNGNILTGAIGSDESIFRVNGGILNIYDCNSENKVHSYKIKEVLTNSTQDLYYGNAAYSNKLFQKYYDFTDVGDGVIVGGIITGGHKYSTKTDLKDYFYYPGGGSAILVGEVGKTASEGTVNVYGGTFSGNTVTALSQWGGKRERSGTIAVIDGGTLNFYNGQIVGNSSRYPGAGILAFGYAPEAARVNIYGGVIKDNYSLDSVYNSTPVSTTGIGGAAIYTENIISQSSIVSISGSPQIVDNLHYDYSSNNFIKTNMSYSLESMNAINVAGLLYTEKNSIKTYAKIGLYGGAANQLTAGYTASGNTHEDVNKIFFADDKTQAVAYNTSNGELKYVTSSLYTLTYNSNSGAESTTSSISVVDKISISQSMFERNGYFFVSWNTKADGTGTEYSPNDIITLTSNQTLYAIWNNANYRINYWTNGGTLLPTDVTSYTYGSLTTLPVPTWSGYTFEGWYDNAMLTGLPVTQINSTDYGDKTYYAKWSGITQYIITSTTGANGTIFPLGSVIYDGISQDYLITPNSGYKVATFTVGGIDKKAQIVNNVYTVTGITADTAINVTFEKILSTDITVYSSSGDNGTISPKGYSIVPSGSDLTYTITPDLGYRIKDVLVNGTSIGAVSTYTLEDITRSQSVQVEFEVASSALTLNYNGGSYTGTGSVPSVYYEGVGYILPTALEMSKSNYTFAGWYENAALSGSAVLSVATSDTGDKTFYAKWSINQYTATFVDYNDLVLSTSTVDYLSGATAPENPTRTGYTFAGWDVSYSSLTEDITVKATYTINQYTATFVDYDGTFISTSTVDYLTSAVAPSGLLRTGYTFDGWDTWFATMTEDITVTAIYYINFYTISFNSDGGTPVGSITKKYGSAVTTPANPTKTGYTFAGWQPAFPTTMPAGDIEYVAMWTINQYTATFVDYDGTVLSTSTVDYLTAAIEPEDTPTRTGYSFNSWDVLFNSMNEDITVTARYSINHYTISFDSDGGYYVAYITQEFNSVVTAPTNPTKTGYTFNGWSPTFPETMPADNIELKAQWTINQYTATFKDYNGSTISTSTVNYLSAATAPTNPSRTGYDFNGWNVAFDSMTADITVTATYIIRQYTITFNSDGGTIINQITQDYGTSVTQPLNPTKTGYSFNGWSGAIPSTMTAENVVLTAQWSISQYTISFATNGGTAVASITQDYNTAVAKPADPSKANHTFGGWYTDYLLTNPYVFSIMPAESMTLYAKWSINAFNIQFESNGGSVVTTITQNFDTVVTKPVDPTKLGYTFGGWYSNSDLTTAYVFNTMPAVDMTLYAKWSINAFNIQFESNGGSAVTTITQNFDTVVTKPVDPTKLGHTFGGWYSNSDLTTAYVFNTMQAESMTLYAKWSINAYNIQFESNGGSAVTTITQNFGSAVTKPVDPTKLGYTFGGWYSDSTLTTAYVFNTMQAESMTLYAKWSINAYNIQFESNGGSAVTTITQNFGSAVTKPVDPTKLGYTFGGWYSNSDLTTAYVFNTMQAESMTLYAKWSINAFNIQFESNGGSVVTTITQNFDTVVTKPVDPTKLGYTFGGWYSNSDLTTAYVFNTMPAESMTLYAKWSINAFNIQFESNGGSVVTTITQNFDTVVTKPVDPTKLGYTFGGWYSDSALTTAYVFNTMPAESMTLYAKWTINSYSIHFESNGGSAVTTITQNFDTVVTKPVDPTKLGYTFGGWYSDSALTTAYVFNTMPAESMTLYAKWTINSYSIHFESNGGSAVTTITQNFDTVVTKPVDPTKLGYTFGGWYSDSALTTAYVFNTMPAESMTLYAKWSINAFNIQFESNGGSAVTTITQNFDTVVTKPVDPTKLGYTFGGWYSNSDLTTAYVFNTMPAVDMTLYAKWTLNTYTITFDTKGGTVIQTVSLEFGETIVQPNNPTKTGFIFNGWNQGLPTVMPAESIILVAYWLKVSDTSSEHGSSNSQDLINAIDPALIVGKDVEVSIVFERKLTTTISETVKSSIESLLKQNQKYAIMDIRVILKAQGQSDIEINELNEKISITLVLSKNEQGHKNYQIIAVHNGQARVIESVYNAEDKTITFETDQFSTFAIVYQTSSQQWGWWFLTLLIPIGFVAYKYRNNWLSLISKKQN